MRTASYTASSALISVGPACSRVDTVELLEYLHRSDETVVSMVGAGLASPAGATSVGELAIALAARARVANGSLKEVAPAAANVTGEPATKAAVADIINSTRISPTPTLTALSTWPAQRLLLTNCCRAIQDAAELAGQQAVPVAARVAEALRPLGARNGQGGPPTWQRC